MCIKNAKTKNTVGLNSIVTIRCQTTVAESTKTTYEKYKIVDDPSKETIHNSVSFNSIIGKALRGGIRNQKIIIQGCDSATIVEIVNDSACHKVDKESVIEIELYRDFECTDLIGRKVVGSKDDIRDQFNNKEINSVVKLYNLRSRSEFAKIINIK